jgi:hypothetical protein
VAKGLTQQFTATGTFSDNSTQNLTSQVTWASATPSVATITAGGLATGVIPGTSSISATLGSVSGSTVLTVSAAVLQSIVVTPANPSVAKGLTQQFTATGTFSDNSTQNLTSQVTWASATPSVATITAGGLATGVTPGTSSISATLGSVTGSTVLTVSLGVVGSVTITPSANPSTYGDSLSFTVVVAPLSGGQTPTGNVQFLIDGSNFGSPVALTGGQATSSLINTLSAGGHAIKVNYLGDVNYAAANGATTQNVNKASLTLVADNQSMNHFDAVPALTYHYTGFVLTDNASNSGIAASVILSTTATSSSTAGYYPIHPTVSSFSATNYTLGGTQDGTTTVKPKVMDVRVHFGTRTMSLIGLNRDLPFININAIDVLFSDNVNVTSSMLQLMGSNAGTYLFSNFKYDAAKFDATWTLPSAIAVDQLMLGLSGATAPPTIGTGPNIAADPFNKAFSVLPGDVNGDGAVTASDLTLATVATKQPYNAFADVDGDGTNTLTDAQNVRKKMGLHL